MSEERIAVAFSHNVWALLNAMIYHALEDCKLDAEEREGLQFLASPISREDRVLGCRILYAKISRNELRETFTMLSSIIEDLRGEQG